MAPRILYVVTEDWYFLSHRLPMARAAKDAGYEVHVATRLKDGKAAIEREGFVAHGLSWSRGSLSPWGSFSAVVELRRLLRRLAPDILHNISLKPVLLGTTASLGLSAIAVVNSLTGLGTLFIGEAGVSALARKTVRYALSRLLGRRRSRTVVQNPDDRAFVIGLGVPPDTVVLIPGSGVDTHAAHAAARAAAAGDRGLCRAHACRQGRGDADRGLRAARQAWRPAPAAAGRRLRPGESGLARARAAPRIRQPVRHPMARPCRRYQGGVGARAFRRAGLAPRGPAEEPARGGGVRPRHGGDRCAGLPRDRHCRRDRA